MLTGVMGAQINPRAADGIFRRHCLNRDMFALSMLKYQNFQGYLITGQHSGTHWIKWMLSHAIAHHYGVPPPRYFDNGSDDSNDLIGHPKRPRRYPDLPRIASSHSIPPYPVQWPWLRGVINLPPYAIVVRDIRKVLISNYEKWRDAYGVSFHEYLAGDPHGERYVCDVWWYIRFQNRWGEVTSRLPSSTLVVRYEDFQSDRTQSLSRVARHFDLPLDGQDLEAAAAVGSKDYMAAHKDPTIAESAVRADGVGETQFSEADMALLDSILDRHLKHDFGYDYFDRPRGYRP
jgi:hypothetical protein